MAGLLALGVATSAIASATPSQLEYAVKASYVVKFGPFVQWPQSAMPPPGLPMRICVVGSDPFGRLLDEAADGQQVQGHRIVILRMNAVDPSAAAQCQIMFIGKPTGQTTAETLHADAGLPILLISDRDRGVAGGMIEFVIDRGRVRFDVDEAKADQCGVKISSKLLALAVKVER